MTIDVGVAGVGMQGRHHARIYSELKSVGEVYVYDLDKKMADFVAKQYPDVNIAEDFQELLDEVQAVSICTPNRTHVDIALECSSNCMDFLIEKPISYSSRDAYALLDAIKSNEYKLVTGVGHIERFNPIVEEIHKIVKNPLYIEIKRHNPTSSRMTHTSVVEDLMIHDIDVLLNVFFKNCTYDLNAFGNSDVACAVFNIKTNNGTICPVNITASRRSAKKIRTIYVETENCTIDADYIGQEIYIYKTPGKYNIDSSRYIQENIVEKVSIGKLEPLRVELSTFVNCIKSREPFPISLEDGLNNLIACELIQSKQSQTVGCRYH